MRPKLTECRKCKKLIYSEDLVTIPASEYRELLARPATGAPAFGKPARARIARDPELLSFLKELAAPGNLTVDAMRAACIERFGQARVPAKTSFHRFLQQLAGGKIPQATMPRRVP